MAVTSNRGEGRVPRRAGANPQLEQQYYEKKYTHPQPGETVMTNLFACFVQCVVFFLFFSCLIGTFLSRLSEGADEDLYRTPTQESPDSHANGVAQDSAALSMAEIASCSYEAR